MESLLSSWTLDWFPGFYFWYEVVIIGLILPPRGTMKPEPLLETGTLPSAGSFAECILSGTRQRRLCRVFFFGTRQRWLCRVFFLGTRQRCILPSAIFRHSAKCVLPSAFFGTRQRGILPCAFFLALGKLFFQSNF